MVEMSSVFVNLTGIFVLLYLDTGGGYDAKSLLLEKGILSVATEV